MKLIVIKPVIDLRALPQELPKEFSRQEGRLTQLLFNEKLLLLQSKGGWLFVEAIEQELFTTSWHGYRGWVREDEVEEVSDFLPYTHAISSLWSRSDPPLSFGSLIHMDKDKILLPNGKKISINPQDIRPLSALDRSLLISDAMKFLKAPYLWGGRAALDLHLPSSVDCSGLTSLLYRAQGKLIPRDAHDQLLKAKKTSTLLPGDFIFLTPLDHPNQRATHVLLYKNKEEFMEAPSTGKEVSTRYFLNDYKDEKGQVSLKGREKVYTPTFATVL